jgi:hypothetical protein
MLINVDQTDIDYKDRDGVVKIKVTEEHIATASHGSLIRCPIALAIKDAIGKQVRVCGYYVYVDGDIYAPPDFVLSDNAIRFIRDFDMFNYQTTAFEFDLINHVSFPPF